MDLVWFLLFYKNSIQKRDCFVYRTSVEYATERCGFVVGRFDFEMNDYPELSTETVGNFGGFAY